MGKKVFDSKELVIGFFLKNLLNREFLIRIFIYKSYLRKFF